MAKGECFAKLLESPEKLEAETATCRRGSLKTKRRGMKTTEKRLTCNATVHPLEMRSPVRGGVKPAT